MLQFNYNILKQPCNSTNISKRQWMRIKPNNAFGFHAHGHFSLLKKRNNNIGRGILLCFRKKFDEESL